MLTRELDVVGVRTHVLEAGSGDVPLVCVHGNPDSAAQWAPLLERAGELGRVIAPDLPGWGRSERPDPGAFDGSLDAHTRWFAALLDALEIDRFRLLVHDWGALALSPASRRASAVARVAIVDGVPLSAAYRWHWLARMWRTRRVGEAAMPMLSRPVVKLLTRVGRRRLRPMPDAWLDSVTEHLDAGTKSAILRLYRSADSDVLARHGERLGDLCCPALVVWGANDPYIGAEEAGAWAHALGGPAEQWVVPGAGHWCMIDEPAVFDRLAVFMASAVS